MELSIAQIIMIAAAVIVGLAFLLFGKQLKTLIGNTQTKVADVLTNALNSDGTPNKQLVELTTKKPVLDMRTGFFCCLVK